MAPPGARMDGNSLHPPPRARHATIPMTTAEALPVALMEVWIYQHFALGWSAAYIASTNRNSVNSIYEKTVRAAIKRFTETGHVDYPPRRTRARKMTPDVLAALLLIVERDPWLYLDEIAVELERQTGASFRREYIHSALHHAGMSLKKMQKIARGRDEVRRAEYWETINTM